MNRHAPARARRRRAPLIAGAAAALALAAAGSTVPAGAQTKDSAVTISAVDVTTAPTVTLTVGVEGALAAQELRDDNFTLFVSDKETPAELTGLPSDPMQVELVIDTSGSMEGAPLEAAKAAATTLVDAMPESVAVGIVGFGDVPYSALDATTDREAAKAAIAGLQSDGETALYDAVVAASQRFEEDRRSLVVLSDGKDTVSTTSLEAAATAVGQSLASTYVVVLQTPEVDLAAAEALATAAGGKVVQAADAAALQAVYESIAGQLAAQYQLSFEAVRTGSTGMEVRVSAGGTTAVAEARASVPVAARSEPAATGAPTPPRVERVPEPDTFEQDWVFVIGGAAFFLALLAAGILIFSSDPTRFNQLADARRVRRASRGSALQALGEQATGLAERSLDASGRRHGLERALELAGVNMRTGEFILLTAASAFAAFAVGLAISGLLVGAVLAVVVVIGSRLFLSIRQDRRRAAFGDQLEQTLPLMAGSLRAGFGLMQSLDAVAQESASPTAEEVRRVVSETRLGRELGDGLDAMADRVGNDDFRWVVQAIEIHQQVGGDLAEVLDKVHSTIRDRNRIRRQIKALSGEGRLSALILFVLPIAMFLFITAVNPEYIGELTDNGLGIALLIVGATLMLLGGLWMRRITRLVF